MPATLARPKIWWQKYHISDFTHLKVWHVGLWLRIQSLWSAALTISPLTELCEYPKWRNTYEPISSPITTDHDALLCWAIHIVFWIGRKSKDVSAQNPALHTFRRCTWSEQFISIAGLNLWLWMIVPSSSALSQPHLPKHHPLLSKVLPVRLLLAFTVWPGSVYPWKDGIAFCSCLYSHTGR